MKKVKVGDIIEVQQAWEDEAGVYHDEFAEVLSIAKFGEMDLKFENEIVNKFLKDAEFYAQDYEPGKKLF